MVGRKLKLLKFVESKNYSYDVLGNGIGFKEYEKQIGYVEDGLKAILGANLSELTPSYEENYILDRTRAYHNLFSKIIDNVLHNIALAKAIQGSAYMVMNLVKNKI